jgi:hypothetical protein
MRMFFVFEGIEQETSYKINEIIAGAHSKPQDERAVIRGEGQDAQFPSFECIVCVTLNVNISSIDVCIRIACKVWHNW